MAVSISEKIPPSDVQNNVEEPVAESPPTLEAASEVPSHRGFRWILSVFAILSSTFLFSLDTTIVADIQPNIIASFGEIDKLPWLAAGFVLPSAALILPWSKAYSIFNIKWLYASHVFLFEVGSAISGAAPNMNALIIGRAIAGVGGCGMYVGGLTFFTMTTTPKERPIYIALIGPVWGLGTVLGPIVGGAFAISSATWRWGFYINLLIGALCAPVILFLLPSIELQPTTSFNDKLKQNDFLGILVFTGWTTSLVMAISFGGSVYAWNSASEIVLWVLSVVLLVLFIATQKLHPFVEAKNRLYPSRLLGNRKILNLQFQTFAAAGIVYVPLFYIPLFFQFARGESALDAAIRLLPFVFMIVFFSLLNGYLMSKLGYFTPWYIFAAAISLVGTTLMYTLDPSTSTSTIYGYSSLLGIGGGSFLLCSFAVAPALVKDDEVYDAIGAVSVAQSFGIVIFVAAAGCIFQNLGVQFVAPILPADMDGDVRSLIAGTSSELFSQLSEASRVQVTNAIIKALDKTYLLVIAASATCLILAPFLGTGKVH